MEQPQTVEQLQAQEEVNASSADDLIARIEKLEATNNRLLTESKEYKTKYQKVRSEVESKERTELESKEEWKELLEKEREEKFRINEQLHSIKKNTLKSQLRFEIAKNAKDAYSIDDIARMIPMSDLEVDEDNLSVHGVTEAIEKLRKEKTYLFQNEKTAKMVTERPSAFDNEPLSYGEELKKARNHMEIEAVMKKHNRL